jgi:hypothetical protein
MSYFSDDLFTLRGRVMNARPGLNPDFVTHAINDRLRWVLDQRIYWADLLKFGILSFPDPYSSGTISISTGSNVVLGSGTNWPVNDVVNTTIPDGVADFGYVEAFPASMSGITANSLLYVDAGGDPEVVPVVEVRRNSFVGNFTKQHNPGCSVWQSSLANLQLRTGQSYPVFTVSAVQAPDVLLTSVAWGGPPISGQTYVIKLMYVTLAPDLKAVLAMKDEQTGYPVRLHVSLEEADCRDPKRMMVAGNPFFAMVDLGANDQGNMLYEVWPAPSNARQFSYAYLRKWPDLVKDTDRPPPFINPSILVYGALADAKMMRVSADDPYYDPAGAQYYEGKFREAVQLAKNADEAKRLDALQNPWWKSILPGNYDQQQLLDPAVAIWDFGGGGLFY